MGITARWEFVCDNAVFPIQAMLPMPQKQLQSVANLIDQWVNTLGRAISWFTLVLVLLTVLVVVLRYAFQIGSIALQESLLYFNAIVFTLGAAYTLKEKGHVRVDIFYARFSVRQQAWVEIFGIMFLLMPSMLFIFWTSWDYVALSWRIKESSAETSGLPLVYLLKTGILLLCGTMLLQGISELLKSLLRLEQNPK